MRKVSLIYFLYILLFSLPSWATVYKVTNSDGSVTYTDIAPKSKNNATQVEITPIQTYKAPTLPNTADEAPAIADDKELKRVPYSVCSIVSPTDNATFQNVSIIPITLDIQPALQADDTIQLYLDGTPIGERSTSQQWQLELFDRGTHVVRATVFNKNDRPMIQSESKTFYLHRNFTKKKKQ